MRTPLLLAPLLTLGFSTALAEEPRPTDIEAHVGPARLEWVNVAQVLVGRAESCVDGRDDHGVVGTPGGDAGEFLLALAALETVSHEPLADEEIDRLFEAYLEAFGSFYMHTDTHALEHLVHAMKKAPKLAAYGKRVRHSLPAPPFAIRPDVIELLLQPENVGCGHLRLILQHPKEYRVRPELARAFLRSYFNRLFAGQAGLTYVVLEGDHAERAVVSVILDREIQPYTMVPAVVPKREKAQVFVNHPQVAAFLRHQEARFLIEEHGWLAAHDVDEATFYEHLAALANVQLATTLSYLASGLPVFEIRFDKQRRCEVREQGHVMRAQVR